jgi:diacylglycerol kinase (ATP)
VSGGGRRRQIAAVKNGPTKVAVIANSGKTIGGGLLELRRVLEAEGVTDPIWCEVPKSRKAPAQVKRALDKGAELIFAWGGDGMVQQCVEVIAGSDASLAIIPAGTSNFFASNLGIPKDIEEAVAIGLRGERHRFDVGRFNGERFVALAGTGFDALMIRDADGALKERLGRIAYLWAGSKNLRTKPFRAEIKVDGVGWYKGDASCILLGNVGDLFAGVEAFEDSRPDDGLLELGVVDAEDIAQWVRTIARAALGTASKSPFVQTTKARSVKIKLNRKVLYELDGGARTKAKSFKVKVEPGAISVCVPKSAPVSAASSEVEVLGQTQRLSGAG